MRSKRSRGREKMRAPSSEHVLPGCRRGSSRVRCNCTGVFSLLLVRSAEASNNRCMDERDSAALKSFLAYLRVEKGLSPLTEAAYKRDLVQFAEFGRQKCTTLLGASVEHVREFLAQLRANGVEPRSVARKISAMRHFYRFAGNDGLVQQDPMLMVESPRQWKVLPKALETEQIDTLLDPAAKNEGLRLRDRALMEVAYAAGLRVSELIMLKQQDVDLSAGRLLVRGKGDKERIIPIGVAADSTYLVLEC